MSGGTYWTIAAVCAALGLLVIWVNRDPQRIGADDDPHLKFRRDTNIVIGSLFFVGAVVWPLLGLVCLGLCGREMYRTVRQAWRDTNRVP